MPELDYTIKTVAELAGAQQTAAALEQQIGKAKALKQDYSELSKQLDTVRASMKAATDGNEDLAKSEKEASEAAEFLHKNHRQIHTLLETMPAVAGSTGGALMQLFRGPLGPALALGAGIEQIRESFSEWQKELDEAAESNSLPQFAASIKAVADDMETARSNAEGYALAVANIAKHETTIAQALEAQVRLIHAVAAARMAAAKAQEDLEKSQIAHKQKTGEITPEQATIHETSAAIAAAKADADAKKKEHDDEISKKQAALDEATLNQRKLDENKKAADDAYLNAQKHRDFYRGDIFDLTPDQLNKKIEEQRKIQGVGKVEDAQNEVEGLEKIYGKNPEGEIERHQLEKARQALKDAEDFENGYVKNLRRGVEGFRSRHSPEANKDLQDKDNAAKQADQKATTNQDEIDKLRRELNEARRVAAATQPDIDKELAARIAIIMQEAVDKLAAMRHGGEVQTAVQLAQAIEDRLRAVQIAKDAAAGHAPNHDDAAFLMKFVAMMGGNPADFNAAVGFVNSNKGLQNEPTRTAQDATGRHLSAADAFLIDIANALGAHVNNLKAAAEFVAKLKDNSDDNLKAVAKLVETAWSNQQKEIDRLWVVVNGG